MKALGGDEDEGEGEFLSGIHSFERRFMMY